MSRLAPIVALALLTACSSAQKKGGYYKDDGPDASPPGNLDRIADARPRAEPLHRFANRPYEVFGRKYVPLQFAEPVPLAMHVMSEWPIAFGVIRLLKISWR